MNEHENPDLFDHNWIIIMQSQPSTSIPSAPNASNSVQRVGWRCCSCTPARFYQIAKVYSCTALFENPKV